MKYQQKISQEENEAPWAYIEKWYLSPYFWNRVKWKYSEIEVESTCLTWGSEKIADCKIRIKIKRVDF